jgi:ribonuclease P/MRP protein subunit RPP40
MMRDWIKASLVNRCQTVRVGICLSPVCAVLSGVTKDSVLGPVVFILYVNDFASCVAGNVSIDLFADDAKM